MILVHKIDLLKRCIGLGLYFINILKLTRLVRAKGHMTKPGMQGAGFKKIEAQEHWNWEDQRLNLELHGARV